MLYLISIYVSLCSRLNLKKKLLINNSVLYLIQKSQIIHSVNHGNLTLINSQRRPVQILPQIRMDQTQGLRTVLTMVKY